MDIYTGNVIETNLKFKVKNSAGKIIDPGAVCSGGEYLISKFKGDPFRGTGISIGIDRLVFCLSQKNNIRTKEPKTVLVCVLDEKYLKNYYELVDQLRGNNISAEVFLNTKKNLVKQLDLANKRQLSVAIICGENELKDNTITIKNLKGVKGQNSQTVPKADLINEVKKLI